ncbi:MAG TPA: hypothetical protein VFA21_09215 [Pyrinomonadaceae bacterium]|nr:hypothetical protein [Pyrinomonadaceae bacterium]
MFALFLITLAAYFIAVVVPAVTFYRSAQHAERSDLEALDAPLNRLGEVLKEKGSLSGFDEIISQRSNDIEKDIADIRAAKDKQAVVSSLESISASLSFIQTRLGQERGKGADAVAELQTKVEALKDKVGKTDSWDKLLGTALERGGAVLLTIIWPLVFLFFFFYIMRAPERLWALLQPFKSVEVGATGLKAEMRDGAEVKSQTESTFEKFRAAAKAKYDAWVEKRDIEQKMSRVVSEVLGYLKNNGKELAEYRSTLHVPDIVFVDTLYQLFNYLPARNIGGGRIFSVRFGLIGKVYRTQKPETQGEVPKASNGTVDKQKLVQEWGMTEYEADKAALDRPSFLCVPLLDDDQDRVGLFYMDSTVPNAFNVADKQVSELQAKITDWCKEKGLTQALGKLKEDLLGNAPLIRIYDR